jgi:uncharacterized alpha-E superfamily protein
VLRSGLSLRRAGTFLERGSTARILDIKYYLLLPSCSMSDPATMPANGTPCCARFGDGYRFLNAGQIDARGIVEFLLLV